MNVVLIGLASCGKTVVGRALALRLGVAFTDLDDVIEEISSRRYGRQLSCNEIFRQYYAETFRGLERDALAHVVTEHAGVLATGGGAPLRPENRLRLRRFGTVVWLTASPATIYRRMQMKGFPAYLESNPTVAAVAYVLEQRRECYAELADLTVDTDALSVSAAAARIIAALEEP